MKPLKERNPALVGIAGLVIVALIAFLAFNADSLPFIGGGTGYTAYFSEDAGLLPGNDVRVAGVTVGHVSSVTLAGDSVRVGFVVKGTWVGNESTVAIDIETILGTKYLALDPLGGSAQDPGAAIPESRTTSPYDVTQAFNELSTTFQQLNTTQVANALNAISQTFANTPPYVHQALTGLASLSQAIDSQNAQIAQLLQGTDQITGTLAGESGEFQTLINDGSLLLAELQQQQNAIGSLLTGTESLATQLSGLVKDDNATLGPMLNKLGQVTTVLVQNQDNLNQALQLAGVYTRLTGNTLGSGQWFDTYLCGLVPPSYGGTHPSTGCEPPTPLTGGK
jgi:phospholipid/cholesterol/gamma-HCH transport system substrate-binding protein